MAKKIVSFWLEDELLERFDGLTERMGYTNEVTGEPNRSAAMRHLIRRAVGDDATAASLQEEVTSFHARLKAKREVIDRRFIEVIREEPA